MKRARNLSEFAELVRQAKYEVDELRACLEYDDDESATYKPYLDPLDNMLRELDESLTTGRYHSTGGGHDLPFMPLFIRHERDIPFREILRTLNATHREGFEKN